MKYIYLILALLFVSCVSKEEADEDLGIGPKYTISGTLYKADGKTVEIGYELQVVAFSDSVYPHNVLRELVTTTTNNDGNFSLEYSEITFDYNTTITILTTSSRLPGPSLGDIPINQNFSRDICMKAIEYKQFKFVFDKNAVGDTLYLASKNNINTGYYYKSVHYFAAFYPLTNISSPFLDSISTTYSEPTILPHDLEFYYTTNKANFDKAISTQSRPADFNSLVKTAKFEIETFPKVNIMELKID